MDVLIRKSNLNGNLDAPPSKSHTHRAFFLASMIDGKTVIKNPLLSKDTCSTLNAFKKLGAVVNFEKTGKDKIIKNQITVDGISEIKKKEFEEIEIDLKNSGTSLRFLTAAAGLFNKKITLFGDDSLNSRPNLPLINSLKYAGSEIKSTNRYGEYGFSPLTSSENNFKTFLGGKFEISGEISSQFTSAILLTAPFLKKDSQVHVLGKQVSTPYVKITENIIKEFLGNVVYKKTIEEESKTIYFVKGKNSIKYEKNIEKQKNQIIKYKVPGDFSSASYIIAGAAILPKSNVIIRNLYPSNQADEALISIMRDLGFNIKWNRNEGFIKVSSGIKEKDKSINQGKINEKIHEIDSRNFPDLVATLVLIAISCNIKMRIYNIDHLKFKETDRIKTIVKTFKKFNEDICEENGEILIGLNQINKKNEKEIMKKLILKNEKKIIIDAKLDHRIVMASAIAGLKRGNVIIKNAEVVSVSYPNFWNDLKSVGASFEMFY